MTAKGLLASAVSLALGIIGQLTSAQTTEFINEIHYDNTGTDTGEFIEVVGPTGTNRSDWSVLLYNGSNGSLYNTLSLPAPTTTDGVDYHLLNLPSNGIQNGSPDGIALVDGGNTVVQFLSYEGTFTAVGGAADGLLSTDIGVSEGSSTPIGNSLQLTGTGTTYEEFSWVAELVATTGAVNSGQTFGESDGGDGGDGGGGDPAPGTVYLNEIHYDNTGTDTGEAIEIAGPASFDLAGWSVVLYNGNGGSAYNTVALSGLLPDCSGTGTGVTVLDFPSNGIQNGSPDGIALVDELGDVVEFLSYEGSFVAVGGAADGLGSADIGVSESSSTPVGFSLQLALDRASWLAPAVNTFGDLNDGTPCGDPDPEPELVRIHEVQGTGDASPLDGTTVIVEGVVVGDLQENNELNGFFMQEEAADEDGDPATSEGIFVFCGGGASCPDVAVGNIVRVTGNVDEFFGQTQLDNDSGDLAVAIVDASNQLALVAPAVIAFPVASVGDLEAFEGMSVEISTGMHAVEYFNFDRFSEIRVWTDGSGADRPFQFTQLNPPDVAGAAAAEAAFRRESILLDDGSTRQNIGKLFPEQSPGMPIFGDASFNPGSPSGGFRGGALFTGIEGVLGYSFSEYRVYLSDLSAGTAIDGDSFDVVIDNSLNPREETPEDVGGALKAASFNVLNYFSTLDDSGPICGPAQNQGCRGADTEAERDRQRFKIVAALAAIDADVVGLIELENTFGVAPEADIVDDLNALMGAGTWTFVDTGTIGTDAIKVGLIYKPAMVSPVGAFTVLDSSVDPRFIDTKNRPPLIQTFQETASGARFTVAVNHFKSKGSPCDDVGDPNLDDGAGNCNLTRTLAARALADYLATDPTDSGDPDFMILGDLNAYAEEDPITSLESVGYTDLAQSFVGSGAYSFVFDGRWGTLDYALANTDLLPQVTGATEWHSNADEPDALDYDDSFNPTAWFEDDAFRSSDHDPVIIGLTLQSSVADILGLYDAAIDSGDLEGVGRKPERREAQLRRFLSLAESLEVKGKQFPACAVLAVAERFIDGKRAPKDRVEGPAAGNIQGAISRYREASCTR